MTPKVSIIVPNYNHAPYLRQRLDSIFNQTFQDFEVIILDDCSTDKSKEIIEEYRNRPQVSHIVYNETNSGSPFKQWAKGFDSAQGEYIWIAESDDWAEVSFLKELTSKMEQNVSMVFCNTFIVTNSQKQILHPSLTSFEMDGKNFISKYLSFENIPYNASSILFKKSNLSSIKTNYVNFRSAGDWLFWIYNSTLGNVIFIEEPLNYCRIHERNTTSQNMKNGILFEENLAIFSYLKKENLFKNRLNMQMAVLLQQDCFFKSLLEPNNKTAEVKSIQKKWEKELIPFARLRCFFFFLTKRILSTNSQWNSIKQQYYCVFRHIDNLSKIQILWTMLSLPKTNIRQKIKRLMSK